MVVCNKGYATCPKTCFFEGCYDECQYASECCTRCCLFPPAEIGGPVGIGRVVSEQEHSQVLGEILMDESSPRAKKFLDWFQGGEV